MWFDRYVVAYLSHEVGSEVPDLVMTDSGVATFGTG